MTESTLSSSAPGGRSTFAAGAGLHPGDSDLDWTLVRATKLVNDPGTGEYRVRADFPPPGGGKIARADVAHFIDTALTSASYIRESPALAY
ncbi:MAG TPA: NAD(P)H-binding protein [Streptosporangiaceae bacterium]